MNYKDFSVTVKALVSSVSSYVLPRLALLIVEQTEILLLYDRKIFQDCSEVFGHFRKMVRNVRMSFGQSSENFQNFLKMFGNLRQIAEIPNFAVSVINRTLSPFL